jgi:hypothetical protein
MKPKLKAPGTERLKLKCDILLSTPAFKFNLCRYTPTHIAIPLSRGESPLCPTCRAPALIVYEAHI